MARNVALLYTVRIPHYSRRNKYYNHMILILVNIIFQEYYFNEKQKL